MVRDTYSQVLDCALLGQFLQVQFEHEQFLPSPHFWHESPQLETVEYQYRLRIM